MKFSELKLTEKLLDGLYYMGFEKATPVQEQAIPMILQGRDLLACAQTGTGKTAAFILPVLHKLSLKESDKIRAVVIAPTRELALQIEQQVQAFAYFVDVSSVAVYGGGDGKDFDRQKKALVGGTDIVVVTPGKFIAHLQNKYVDLSHVEYLILDEADRMLDMGFLPDIEKIMSYTPKGRQSLLFSATMPPKIRELSKKMLKNPGEVSIAISKPAEGLVQAAYLVYDRDKAALIRHLIADKPSYESIIVFSSTKKKVSEIVRALSRQNYKVQAISSDLGQSDREDALRKFRSKETRVIVATDVLSRGIDIKGINLVVNFDVPRDAEDYVHRIGRTARADESGVALTLVNPDDVSRMMNIEKLIDQEVMKVPLPDGFGAGPEYKITRSSHGGGGRGRGGGGHGRSGGGGRHSGGKNRSRGGGGGKGRSGGGGNRSGGGGNRSGGSKGR